MCVVYIIWSFIVRALYLSRLILYCSSMRTVVLHCESTSGERQKSEEQMRWKIKHVMINCRSTMENLSWTRQCHEICVQSQTQTGATVPLKASSLNSPFLILTRFKGFRVFLQLNTLLNLCLLPLYTWRLDIWMSRVGIDRLLVIRTKWRRTDEQKDRHLNSMKD